MKIDRTTLVSELYSFATRASGVLVGRPGVGKSYALRQLCELFKQKGRRFLFLPVELLGEVSDDEIRSYTNHSGDFISDLKKASEPGPGVVVFDGFDAARNEKARAKLLHLIRRCVIELRGKWHVLVSVRTYDAQKSEDLLEIFGKPVQGDNPRYRAEEFSCRHFVVPLLSEEEINLALTNERLRPLARHISNALRELLRIPFNIWLLEQVAADNIDDESLTGVRSQVQLLSLFWRKRVQGRPDALSREATLAALVEHMIRAHSLFALKPAVLKTSDRTALAALLSDDILTEAGINRNQIAFSHNILFDYAVSMMALDEQPKELARFIADDPATPFFLRPSFIYLLTALWYEKRDSFWTLFWWRFPEGLLSARLFGRLVPPGVLVSEAYREEDLTPLLHALTKDGNEVAPAARSVLQALRALGPQRTELWASFAAMASKNPPSDLVWDLTILGHDLLEQASSSQNPAAVKSIGYLARNLLTWIWKNRKGSKRASWDRLGGTFLVSMVARTFGTDPGSSLAALAPVLDLPKEPGFPIEYLYRLSNEIDHIWEAAPDFVAHLYDLVFAYDERSEEKTQMGGTVLQLTSTRRQDFNMCRWLLTEKFGEYLSARPHQATRAGVRSLNAHVIAEHVIGYLKKGVSLSQATKTFAFRGAQSTLIEDASWIWDSSPHHDEPIRLADQLFAFIGRIPEQSNAERLANEVLDVFRDSATVAFLWRRLLKAGATAPKFFGPLLYELTIAEPIQLSSETLVELTSFVEAAYPYLTEDQRIQFEGTVLRLHPSNGSGSERETAVLNRRNRLIGRLPKDLIATKEVKQIHDGLVATSSIPANEPLSRITSWSRPYTTEHWLKDEGVDVDSKSNKAVLDEAKALHSFHDAWLNKRPTKDAIYEILPKAETFWAMLAKSSGLPGKLYEYCWTSISEAAAAMARGVEQPTEPAFEFAQSVLVAAADRLDVDEPGAEEKEVSGWGPSAETAAASGLAWLLRLSPSKEPLEAFGRLIRNGSAPARYLAVTELRRIRRAAPAAFWELATHVAMTEKNQSVVLALFHSVGADLRHDINKVTSTIDVLVKRFALGREDSKLTEAFVEIAIWLYVAGRSTWSTRVLEQLIKQPIEFAHALRDATFAALRVVNLSYMKPDSRSDMDRSVAWLLTAIGAAGEGLDLLLRAPNDKQDAVRIRALYGVLDEVVLRLYLAISREGSKDEELKDISAKDREDFYAKVVPLLNQVIDTSSKGRISGLAAPTAHHFMELLNHILEFNPRDSLRMARKVAVASESYGYNLDSLAIREVVKLVERVLVDFREIARDSLDDLLVLLDIFATTGWPEALRLIWRLDEAFR